MIDPKLDIDREIVSHALIDQTTLSEFPVEPTQLISGRYRNILSAIKSLYEVGGTHLTEVAIATEMRRLGLSIDSTALKEIYDHDPKSKPSWCRAELERQSNERAQKMEAAQAVGLLGGPDDARGRAVLRRVADAGIAPELGASFLFELGDDVLAEPPPPKPFLLMRKELDRGVGWLPRKEVAVLAAAGGVGKSTLLCQWALGVATGLDCSGCYVPNPGRVLLALAEEDTDEILRKLHWTARALELTPDERRTALSRIAVLPLVGRSARLLEGQRGMLTETSLLHSLQRYLRERGDDWALVVLDPLARFCAPEAELDNAAASETLMAAATLTKAPGGPTVLLAHHITKNSRGTSNPGVGGMRGAGALSDEARWVATMWPDEADQNLVHVKCVKANYSPPGPEILLRRGRGGVLSLASVEQLAEFGGAA